MAAISAAEIGMLDLPQSMPTLDQVNQFIAAHTGERSVIFLAEAEGQIIGTINLTRFGWPQLDHVVWLGLNVAAEFRNHGIGHRLLACGLQWASQVPQIERVELEVIADNFPAIHLYESFGFVREGVKRSAVKKGGQHYDVFIYGLLQK
jgi:RimJ/RimL family protein N-acetyltransferase